MNTDVNISTVDAVSVTSTSKAIAGVASFTTWHDLVNAYINDLDVRNSSKGLYTRTLTQFFLWVDSTDRRLDQMTRPDIIAYKQYLLTSGLSALTVCSYIEVVRKFYRWTEANKLYPNIATEITLPRRTQAHKKQHLTDEKSKELLDYFDGLSARDYAIVNLILRTGLRTIEVTRLNIEDITFKGDRRVLRVWGKGHDEKDSFVVLTDKSYLPIKNYLALSRKGAKAGEPLFTSASHQNTGSRLTTRTISGLCKSGLKAIGLDGKEFTAHSLRHTTGCAILKHGGTLQDVQDVLRHTNPATSQIYVESINEELRLEKCPEAIIDDAF